MDECHYCVPTSCEIWYIHVTIDDHEEEKDQDIEKITLEEALILITHKEALSKGKKKTAAKKTTVKKTSEKKEAIKKPAAKKKAVKAKKV